MLNGIFYLSILFSLGNGNWENRDNWMPLQMPSYHHCLIAMEKAANYLDSYGDGTPFEVSCVEQMDGE
jgi:hypothetical protein